MKTYIANAQVENLKRFWTKIAKEAIHMGYAPGVIYGYCSELGVLKILNEYRFSEKAKIGYSKKYSSWYLRLEITTS